MKRNKTISIVAFAVILSVALFADTLERNLAKGVSCVAFISNGPHLHYHLPGDSIYRINPDIMADISRLAFLSGFN